MVPRGAKSDICSSFDMREVRDYYIANENRTIMRYKVTVNEDNLTTLQFSTSKADVNIKFAIYDNGELVLSVNGKGTALIPAFVFLKNRDASTAGASGGGGAGAGGAGTSTTANESNAGNESVSRPESKTCKNTA